MKNFTILSTFFLVLIFVQNLMADVFDKSEFVHAVRKYYRIRPRKCQLRQVFGSTPQVYAALRQLSNNRFESLFFGFIRLPFYVIWSKVEAVPEFL